ncbi:DUF4240 domain-containing protein [Streptomyces aurantiogriseus]
MLLDRLCSWSRSWSWTSPSLRGRYDRAYTWDLWGAAWVLLDGASDDAFDFFRCWLIGQGREV